MERALAPPSLKGGGIVFPVTDLGRTARLLRIRFGPILCVLVTSLAVAFVAICLPVHSKRCKRTQQ